MVIHFTFYLIWRPILYFTLYGATYILSYIWFYLQFVILTVIQTWIVPQFYRIFTIFRVLLIFCLFFILHKLLLDEVAVSVEVLVFIVIGRSRSDDYVFDFNYRSGSYLRLSFRPIMPSPYCVS